MEFIPQYKVVSKIINICSIAMINVHETHTGIIIPSVCVHPEDVIYKTRAIGCAIRYLNDREKNPPYAIQEKQFMQEKQWLKYIKNKELMNAKWPEYCKIFKNVKSFDGPFKTETGEFFIGVTLYNK